MLDGPGNDFEQDSVGTYEINGYYITEIRGILLENAGGGLAGDWHVAWVRVENGGKTYYRENNEWLPGNSHQVYQVNPE